jgi:hypothetical protein
MHFPHFRITYRNLLYSFGCFEDRQIGVGIFPALKETLVGLRLSPQSLKTTPVFTAEK